MIVFDTETTGLVQNMALPLKGQPHIIELFAQRLHPETLELQAEFHSLFNPGIKLEKVITDITGLKDEDLKDAPKFVEKYQELCQFFLGTIYLVGHNVSFDRDMLVIELSRLDDQFKFPWPMNHVCTVEATEHMKGFKLNLAALHQDLFKEGFDNAHRAESDVKATVRCFIELRKQGLV